MLSSLEYLAVGVNGAYADDGEYRSDSQQVDTLIEHLKAEGIDELVMYFHGGLVSEIAGAASVQKMIDCLVPGREKRHVMGVLWKTGLKETLKDNLLDIFSSKQGKSLLRWVIRVASKKLGVPSAKFAGSNGFSFDEIDEQIATSTVGTSLFEGIEFDFDNRAKSLSLSLSEGELEQIAEIEINKEYQGRPDKLVQEWEDTPKVVSAAPELLNANNTKGLIATTKLAKIIGKLAYQVIRRFIAKTDHGFHATVIEEICRSYYLSDVGQWVWGEMKDKAEEMWSIDSGPCKDFLQKLQQEIPDITLQLVGHSAGSICISHLLNKIEQNQWQVNVDNIFWLAPAAQSQLFKSTIIDKPDRFNSFRMFTMTDKLEREDTLVKSVPWIYPSSLLYAIAGILEDNTDFSLSGMARYHSGEKPYQDDMHQSVVAFLEPYGRRVLSRSPAHAPAGFQTQSVTHGGFDDDHATLASIAHVLNGTAATVFS